MTGSYDGGAGTPPPTPPRVVFDPPLFFQRRTAVSELLSLLHKLPRFNGKLKSLLDVGCGTECLLLRSLLPPSDELPLEQITGIDVDQGLWDRDLIESLKPENCLEDGGRWRKLGLTLLSGSFERLGLSNLMRHDVVVSSEVIEHLDPGPLSNFATILLGELKPKVCIITTPNREFNDIFNLPFTPDSKSPTGEGRLSPITRGSLGNFDDDTPTLPPGLPPIDAKVNMNISECATGDSKYWREGVPYAMRHPDHRFEWTRKEFRDWARAAAEEHGYTVSFTGVGGFRNGMCVINSSGWAVRKALKDGCRTRDGVNDEISAQDAMDEEGQLDVLDKATEVWGDCSQIAIFIVQEEEEENLEELVKIKDWSKDPESNPFAFSEPPPTTSQSPLNPWIFLNPVAQVVHFDYPYEADDIFPPSYVKVIELLEQELPNFLPSRIMEEWNKTPEQLAKDRALRVEAKENRDSFENLYCMNVGGNNSDSECDYEWNPELDGDETVRRGRKKERRTEKRKKKQVEESVLGGKRADLIRVVKVLGIPLRRLWESGSWNLKRVCRYRFEVFKDVLMNVENDAERGRGGLVQEPSGERDGSRSKAGCSCSQSNYYKVIINTTGVELKDEDENGYCSPYQLCMSCESSTPTTPLPTMNRRRRMSISKDSIEDAELTAPISMARRPSTQSNASDSTTAFSPTYSLFSYPSSTKQKESETQARAQPLRRSMSTENPVTRQVGLAERSSSYIVAGAGAAHGESPSRVGLVRFAGMAEVWPWPESPRIPTTPDVPTHLIRPGPDTLIPTTKRFQDEEHVEVTTTEAILAPQPQIPQHHNCFPPTHREEVYAPESDANVLVKLYSVSATRSALDLIRVGMTQQDKQVLRRWKIVRVEFNPFVGMEGGMPDQSGAMPYFSADGEVESSLQTDMVPAGRTANEIMVGDCILAETSTQHTVTGWENWSFGQPASDPGEVIAPNENMDYPQVKKDDCENIIDNIDNGDDAYDQDDVGNFDNTGLCEDDNNVSNSNKVDRIETEGGQPPYGTDDDNGNGDEDQPETASSMYSTTTEDDEDNSDWNHKTSSFSYYSSESAEYYSSFATMKYRIELVYGLEEVESSLSIDETPIIDKGKGKASDIVDQPATPVTTTAANQNNADLARFMILSSSGIGVGGFDSSSKQPLPQGIESRRILSVPWKSYEASRERVSRWIEHRRKMQREQTPDKEKILVEKVSWDDWCRGLAGCSGNGDNSLINQWGNNQGGGDDVEAPNVISERICKLKVEGEGTEWQGLDEDEDIARRDVEVSIVAYKARESWVWEQDGSEEDEDEIDSEEVKITEENQKTKTEQWPWDDPEARAGGVLSTTTEQNNPTLQATSGSGITSLFSPATAKSHLPNLNLSLRLQQPRRHSTNTTTTTNTSPPTTNPNSLPIEAPVPSHHAWSLGIGGGGSGGIMLGLADVSGKGSGSKEGRLHRKNNGQGHAEGWGWGEDVSGDGGRGGGGGEVGDEWGL